MSNKNNIKRKSELGKFDNMRVGVIYFSDVGLFAYVVLGKRL